MKRKTKSGSSRKNEKRKKKREENLPSAEKNSDLFREIVFNDGRENLENAGSYCMLL